ncbi:hypothetical protein D3C85_1236490 [compost metagenome]
MRGVITSRRQRNANGRNRTAIDIENRGGKTGDPQAVLVLDARNTTFPGVLQLLANFIQGHLGVLGVGNRLEAFQVTLEFIFLHESQDCAAQCATEHRQMLTEVQRVRERRRECLGADHYAAIPFWDRHCRVLIDVHEQVMHEGRTYPHNVEPLDVCMSEEHHLGPD